MAHMHGVFFSQRVVAWRRSIIFGVVAVVLVACLQVTQIAMAHGNEASFEKTVDGLLVDIGYDPAVFIAGESIRLDFALFSDLATNEQAPFSDIWVLIEKEGGGAVFASGLHNPSIGKPLLTLTFPEAGSYVLHARYQQEGGSVAEASFPFVVEPSRTAGSSSGIPEVPWLAGSFVLGAMLGAIGLAALRRT